MAKAEGLPKGDTKKTISVRLTADEIRTLLYIAKRYPADMADEDDLAPAIRRCIKGFGGRKAATDQHGGKVRVLTAAKKDGTLTRIPVEAKTKRYQPLFPQAAVDAPGTTKAVKKWMRQAPILTWTISKATQAPAAKATA